MQRGRSRMRGAVVPAAADEVRDSDAEVSDSDHVMNEVLVAGQETRFANNVPQIEKMKCLMRLMKKKLVISAKQFTN